MNGLKKAIEENKFKLGLFFNAAVVCMTAAMIIMDLYAEGVVIFTYLRIDAAVLMAISSLIYIIYILMNRDCVYSPHLLRLLRFTAVSLGLFVLLGSIVIYAATAEYGVPEILFSDKNLVYRTLAPLISLISFLLFEPYSLIKRRYALLVMALIMAYFVIILIMTINETIQPPYFFMEVKSLSDRAEAAWALLITAGAFEIGNVVIVLVRLVRYGKISYEAEKEDPVNKRAQYIRRDGLIDFDKVEIQEYKESEDDK